MSKIVIDIIEQTPTLTRAEVWIDGQLYAFEDNCYLTGEDIIRRVHNKIKEGTEEDV